MIKWIVALKYRADQPAEECRRYWIEQHGPMALELPGRRLVLEPQRAKAVIGRIAEVVFARHAV